MRLLTACPAFVAVEEGSTLQTTVLQIEDGKITGIYVARIPDKLRHLGGAVFH